MNRYKEFIPELMKILDEKDIKVNEYMKKHTSFRVGGYADILVTPQNKEELAKVIIFAGENKIPYFVIGLGSNLLVKDGGIRGLVIKLGKLDKVTVKDGLIKAESGASLAKVARFALKNSLSGMEFASGIPGSIGGAIAMNAGAYGGEMKDIAISATVLNKDGEIIELKNGELELGYRTSAILKYGYIVLDTTFKLEKGDIEEIDRRTKELMTKRNDKQPLEYPSAGSTFKRPVGHFAGKLIEDSNLKGEIVGGAQVSTKHSGFIINKDGATAKDILDLISHVQQTVRDNFGIELETEVRIVGEDENN